MIKELIKVIAQIIGVGLLIVVFVGGIVAGIDYFYNRRK